MNPYPNFGPTQPYPAQGFLGSIPESAPSSRATTCSEKHMTLTFTPKHDGGGYVADTEAGRYIVARSVLGDWFATFNNRSVDRNGEPYRTKFLAEAAAQRHFEG